ncbi:MAG: hypothetical protein WCZ98_01380 [Sideroxydans sp.]
MLYDDDLLFGDPSEVANFLGVTARTLRRYKANPEAMPEAAKRLLRLRLEGDLRAVGGNAWEGFYLGRDGKLYAPMWERGLSADVVKGMFFTMQEAAALRVQVRDLQARVEALKSGIDYLRQGGRVAALQHLGDLAPLQVRHQGQGRRTA